VTTAAWIYSLGAGPRNASFSAVYLILVSALSATIMTTDVFNLFVCLEMAGITSYVLIASSGKPGAALASFSYLLISASSMVFFLLGVYGLYRLTGALSYEGIAQGLQSLPDGGGTAAVVSLALMIAAVSVRVAVMPVSGWLPDAHALAPHAVSAVLSGVLIKVPLFALARVMLLMPAGMQAGALIGYAGAFTALFGVILALSQKDAKRLLAYHSISQIGYVVSAWGAAVHVGVTTPAGAALMAASFLHGLYHAMFKGLLFLSIGTTVDRTGQRDVYQLRGAARILRSGGERIPVTCICFFIGALAISAIPPFNGYVSKTALSHVLSGSFHYYLLTAAGVGTAASFIKLSRIYWPQKQGGEHSAARGRTPASVYISQLFLGGLCIAGGISASAVFAMVVNLLSASGAPVPEVAFYSSANMLKALLTVAAGLILFLLTATKKGGALLTTIRTRPRGFQDLFISFSLAAAVLVIWML